MKISNFALHTEWGLLYAVGWRKQHAKQMSAYVGALYFLILHAHHLLQDFSCMQKMRLVLADFARVGCLQQLRLGTADFCLLLVPVHIICHVPAFPVGSRPSKHLHILCPVGASRYVL